MNMFKFIQGMDDKSPSVMSAKEALKGKMLELTVSGREHFNASGDLLERYDVAIEDVEEGATMADLLCAALEQMAERSDIPAELVTDIEVHITDDLTK
jgi:hypothetical protein